MVIEILEVATALAGILLLWRKVVVERFRSFATSVFLLCFVPLFCVYPVIGRWLAGGAISIDTRVSETLRDPAVYFIYQGYVLLLLAGCMRLGALRPRQLPPVMAAGGGRPVGSSLQAHGLFAGMCLGVYLYVYSTGLSVADLLTATRFEWFLNDNYSSLLSVVAAYFVALTPALIYLAAKDGRRLLLVVTLLLLICYGILSKDRKWLIFIASGMLAARYVKMRCEIMLSGRTLVSLGLLGVVLTFWQVARGLIFTSLVTGSVDLTTEIPLMAEKLLTRGDLPYYYNASVTAIHLNLNEGFSIPLGVLRRQLFFFIPVGFSFGLKIEDISAIFSDAVSGGDDVRRGNMPPGLIGLMVLSFEWWGGWIIALGIPFVLRAIDNLIRRRSGIVQIAVLSCFLSATLLLLRGDDSSATYFIFFTIIVLYLIRASIGIFQASPTRVYHVQRGS